MKILYIGLCKNQWPLARRGRIQTILEKVNKAMSYAEYLSSRQIGKIYFYMSYIFSFKTTWPLWQSPFWLQGDKLNTFRRGFKTLLHAK